MTQSLPAQSKAVAAFLRGLERRAQLLAEAQTGDRAAAHSAVAVATRVFIADADSWPIAQWPLQFWRLLLSTPALRRPDPGPHTPLPGITRLPVAQRAAVLLHMVATLQEADAAAALGIDVAHYQQRIRDALPKNSLNQPDLDVWRAWSAAAQRALAAAPVAATPTAEALPAAPATSQPHAARPHQLRWLWWGVLACAVALAATFLVKVEQQRTQTQLWFPEITQEALPEAAKAKAYAPREEASDSSMPTSALEQQLAQQLPFLAWLATDPEAALPLAALPVQTPAAQDWRTLAPAQRGAMRGAWAQWQTLTERERLQLRSIASRFAGLPPEQQLALRQRYAALPFDAHRGWLLGPQLGKDWPRISALFTFVTPEQRGPLLQLLREASADEIDTLARLAQTTPPQAREQFRRDLLAQPPAHRAAYLQRMLQH